MRIRSPYGVLGVLVAGSFLLSAGCAALNPANLGKDGGVTGGSSVGGSASLIGNNSAALANQGLASLGNVLGDASGLRGSKQSSSLIGNNSAALIGNNSAALIGNNSAAYRTSGLGVLTMMDPASWSDTGSWPNSLTASTSVTGVISATQDGTKVEEYHYAHNVTGVNTGSGVAIQTAYNRTEDVIKSLYRQVGHYVVNFLIDQTQGSPTQGDYILTQDFTPSAGGDTRHLRMTHAYALGVHATAGLAFETLSGITSQGASVSMSTYSQINGANAADTVALNTPNSPITVPGHSIRYQQQGRIDVNGHSYQVTTDIGGTYAITNGVPATAVSTGSIDLVTLGASATDSVKLHLTLSQGSGQTVTTGGQLLDGNDKAIATVAADPARGIYLATYSDGSTSSIPFDTVNEILSVATNHSDDNF